MTEMKPLSRRSTARYAALVQQLAKMRPGSKGGAKVAFVDRHDPQDLWLCDLATGRLSPATAEAEIIIAERFRDGLTADLDIAVIKANLATGGVLLVRRSSLLSRFTGLLMGRRDEDRKPSVYGRGHDRREAAIRRAGLYLTAMTFVYGARRPEKWLVASTSPIRDMRVRDSIGRVATDYLRTVGPVIVGTGLHLPSL